MSEPPDYGQRIHEIAPELTIEQMRLNQDGLLNDVVIVNEQFVFRFVKRDFGYKDPREEAEILRLLRPYLTLPVPEPFYVSAEALAYRLIPGETLRRELLPLTEPRGWKSISRMSRIALLHSSLKPSASCRASSLSRTKAMQIALPE
jgi:aminoglycoside 2''-phosphotransferase